MQKIVSTCPVCSLPLEIVELKCSHCGLELRNNFELSVFDRLSSEQLMLLMTFLECKGNFVNVQKKLQMSYPYVQKKFSELLAALDIGTQYDENLIMKEEDMKTINVDTQSNKASEIIKAKLIDSQGSALVKSLTGNHYKIYAATDGVSFVCDELPIKPPYTYEVFDVVVDLLISQGGKAKKGQGRNARLGDDKCEETTVCGAIGKNYSGKEIGEFVYDPVFIIAAVLEWADIAYNRRGYIELTASYKSKL